MRAIISLDERLAAPDDEDEDDAGFYRDLGTRVNDALRLWRALENPREVLASHETERERERQAGGDGR